MAVGELWFGVVAGTVNHFEWVPQPDLPVATRRRGYTEQLQFENGGVVADRSQASHREFDFNIGWDRYSAGVERYADFASGLHGRGMCYFSDPFWHRYNLFPPHFASPMLAADDWPSPSTGAVVYSTTAGNVYGQPRFKGTWTITTAANATPLTDTTIPYALIPIPPDMTLHLGWTGAATGTAVVRIESWANEATSAGATASLTALAETGSTRLNTTVAGSSYAFAKVFITRTSAAASTITPISMMAQLWPSADSPTLTGSHVQGRGHSGLLFQDDAASEDYVALQGGEPVRALSTTLLEVGAWS